MGKKSQLLLVLSSITILLGFFTQFSSNYLQPIALIVPHQNIVKQKRLEFFQKIAQRRTETNSIIILSPDHFSLNQHSIFFSDQDWWLSNGQIEYDRQLGEKITASLVKQNGLLTNDHGVFNLLSDIKKAWPKAKIVPILIGQGISFNRLEELSSNINNFCGKDCLVIASVDFSHYLPKTLADIHDQKSLEVIRNLKAEVCDSLEVDSQQSLFISMNFAQFKKATDWSLFYHSNSGEIEGAEDGETTSHIFGWYQRSLFKKKADKADKAVTTFLLATNLDQISDLKSLGERFFYGVDYLNIKLQKPYSPSAKIIIEPTKESSSKVKIESGILKISLANDLAVAGHFSLV